VKIQVEFNPEIVREYRLIGYETRRLDREDFNNDHVDAGDIGAGHTVTAIYEIALQGSAGALIDPLRYDTVQKPRASATTEIAFLRLRYKAPNGATSRLVEQPIERSDLQADLQNTSETYRFSAAVAAFGQLLRGGEYIADLDYAGIVSLAQGARGSDPFGYRGEFLNLVRTADALSAHVDVQGG
jgi:Ca-activated chloride channel family protein